MGTQEYSNSERGQNININRNLRSYDSSFLEDFEGFKASVDEVRAGVVEVAKERALDAEPEDVTELLQSHTKMATKDLEY